MGYQVRIRNNETGEVRTHSESSDWNDTQDFMWLDGNYACDCNRHLLFERAAGNEPDLSAHRCGDSRYTVIDATPPDGSVIGIDEEATPAEV